MSRLASMALVAASNRRPPSFRAGATVRSVSATLSAACNIPTGTRVNDALVAVVTTMGADTAATPTGWTLQGAAPTVSTGTGTNLRSYCFTRVADGTEGASLTVTKTGTFSAWRIDITAWGNTAGIDVFASNAVTTSGDNSPILPTITPTVENSVVVGVVCMSVNGTVTPSTHSITVWQDTSGGTPEMAFTKLSPVPASATGTATYSYSTTTKWVTFALGLKHI